MFLRKTLVNVQHISSRSLANFAKDAKIGIIGMGHVGRAV